MDLSLLNLFLVLLTAWAAGRVADRAGFPSVLGELLAGIALGPPLLGLLAPSEALAVLSEFGVLLLMLYVGMELDPKAIRRASTGGVLAAVGGFVTPFVLCYLLVVGLGGTPMAGVFVGMAAGVTSLATKSRILLDLGLLDTRIAYVMMAGALVADTMSLVVFAGVLGVAEAGALEWGTLGVVGLKVAVYFVVALAVGLWVLPRVGRWLVRQSAGPAATLMVLVVVMLAFAEGAHLAGMHGVIGAFLAGMFLREETLGRKPAHQAAELVRDSSLGLLAPIFFVTAGFAVDPSVVVTSPVLFAGVFTFAIVGKVAGTALFYLPTGHGWREGVAIGLGMNGRGAVEVIVAQVGLSMGLITTEIFSVLVLMAVGTTALVPFTLTWAARWLDRRGDLARARPDRSGTILVGAGPVARVLAGVLEGGGPVRLVDTNPNHLSDAAEAGFDVLTGSALDEDVLEEAGAVQARRLVAVTANAEVNAIAGGLARSAFGVPEVRVASASADALAYAGATALFGGDVDLEAWDGRVVDRRVELVEVPLAAPASAAGLADALGLRGGVLPLAYRRDGAVELVHGDAALAAGDVVVALAPSERPVLRDEVDRLVTEAPVLDLDGPVSMETLAREAAAALGARVGLDEDAFVERLIGREALSGTVVLPGLAVPHLRLEPGAPLSLALVRSRGGVEFPSAQTPVRAAFVVATPPEARSLHLRVLSAIAQVAQAEDFEARWLAADGAEGLRRLVLEAPRRRVRPASPPTGEPARGR